MRRRANSSTSTWDEEINDESVRAMLEDTIRRVKPNDPAKGRRDVVAEEGTVWLDDVMLYRIQSQLTYI